MKNEVKKLSRWGVQVKGKLGKFMKRHKRWMKIWEWWRQLVMDWERHRNSAMAAAIAYRSLFMVVPMVIFLMLVSRWFYETDWINLNLESQLQGQLSLELVKGILVSWEDLEGQGLGEEIDMIQVGLMMLVMLYGALGVVRELMVAIEIIWAEHKQKSYKSGWRRRGLGLVVVMILGGLVLVATIAGAMLTVLGQMVGEFWVLGSVVSYWLSFIVMPPIIFAALGLVYWLLPPVRLKLKDIFLPTVITTGLLMISQVAARWYLTRVNVAQYSGAVGSLLLFMLWVYWAAMVILAGVELTRLYAERWGSLRQGKLKKWWKKLRG